MDISIISGQMALLHVRLEPGDGFEVYGGTSEDALRVERQDDEWLVTLDEVDVAGRPLVRFNVYARQVSTGREWVIFGGKVLVSQRTATAPGDVLAPVEYFVTVPVVENAVDLTGTAIVTGIVGPRGYSAYEVAVLEGFVGTEAEWLENMRQQTATLAVEKVTPLMERAETAADKSEREAAAAKTEQETAAAHAKAAKESELAAAEHQTAAAGEVTKAAAEVQKAAAEVEKAKLEREAAAGHAAAAAKSAQDAQANKQSAEQAALDAAQAQVAARQHEQNAATASQTATQKATEASNSAAQAATDKAAAEQAKTEAQAAQSTAEEQADKATAAAAAAQSPESLAVQAARPATMVLLREEMERLLGDSASWVVDTDGEKVVVHTDRLEGEQLAAVEDVLARFVPGFIGLRQYNHDISIPWREIPDGFKVVEYLEASGQQTILCHKIAWGYNGRVEADLMWTNKAAAGWQSPWTLAGMPQNSEDAPEGADASWRRWSIMGMLRWDYGIAGSESPDMVSGGTITEGVRYNIIKNAEKNYIDGKLVSSNGKAAWNWRYNVAPRLSGDGKNYGFWGRYFYFKAFLGDELELNLIPCLDPTGAPCMVDRVGLTAFYNSGPGDFTYPGKEEEEATTYSLRRPVMYGQLTPHGVRRLYHVPRGYDGPREAYAAEFGFKVLVETPEPEAVEGKVWVPEWHETEEELVLEWVETDPPEEELLTTE